MIIREVKATTNLGRSPLSFTLSFGGGVGRNTDEGRVPWTTEESVESLLDFTFGFNFSTGFSLQ